MLDQDKLAMRFAAGWVSPSSMAAPDRTSSSGGRDDIWAQTWRAIRILRTPPVPAPGLRRRPVSNGKPESRRSWK